MNRKLFVFLALICALPLHAQVVMNFGKGQGVSVHGKQLEEYAVQTRTREQLRNDSTEYANCLTRGFNALHTDSLKLAESYFQKALKIMPDRSGNDVLRHQLGRICMARTDYPAAIGYFTEILKRQPLKADVRLDRATCYLDGHLPQKALEDCQAIFNQTRDTLMAVRTLFIQSAAHTQLRQYQLVKEDLHKILKLDPQNKSVTILYALNLARLGQPNEALNRLNMYLSVNPDDEEAKVAREEVMRGLRIKD